uniref:Uncharacterized protein n=1 Tax=Acrobeloides nanus TaxID=290746 RepID=A0A914DMC5_9BILA
MEKPPQILVSHLPDPSAAPRPNHLPILTFQTDNLNTPTIPNGLNHSPSNKIRLTYPKRKYSHGRHDSLVETPIPVFTKSELRLRKKGPSSPTTVLTMAGLFVCGLTLMLSGVIVLIQQADDRPFVIAGSIFLAVGALMILSCVPKILNTCLPNTL